MCGGLTKRYGRQAPRAVTSTGGGWSRFPGTPEHEIFWQGVMCMNSSRSNLDCLVGAELAEAYLEAKSVLQLNNCCSRVWIWLSRVTQTSQAIFWSAPPLLRITFLPTTASILAIIPEVRSVWWASAAPQTRQVDCSAGAAGAKVVGKVMSRPREERAWPPPSLSVSHVSPVWRGKGLESGGGCSFSNKGCLNDHTTKFSSLKTLLMRRLSFDGLVNRGY